MKIKKAGHIHSFGSDCAICCVNHPLDHKRINRLTRRQRKDEQYKPKETSLYGKDRR